MYDILLLKRLKCDACLDLTTDESENLKGDPILGAFLHNILGKVLLMNSLDVSTLFVSQNMSY